MHIAFDIHDVIDKVNIFILLKEKLCNSNKL